MRIILDEHIKMYNQKKDMLLQLNNVSNKYPKFINHLMNLFYMENCKENYKGMILEVYKSQIKYKNMLKQESFSILNFDNIEKMEDAINYIKLVHSSHKLLKSIISKKYKHLITPTIILKSKFFIEKGVTETQIQEMIGKKIARFKTAEEFEFFVGQIIKSMSKNSPTTISKKAESLNALIIQNENNKLIIQVLDYNTSVELGAKSWCISYSENYWNQYTSNKSILSKIGLSETKQFFIWDFDKDELDGMHLIGVTITNGNVEYAQDNNDDPVDKQKISEQYNVLLKKDKLVSIDQLNKKIDKLELSAYLKESLYDHVQRNFK